MKNNKTMTAADVRALINKRREELRAIEIERRKKEFDRLPEKQRRAYEAIGWSPYQIGKVTTRASFPFMW